MIDLSKYDIDCSKEITKPIYAKRYKDNGEEYLIKVDEINIEEDLKEKQLEIQRLEEIMDTQERLKTKELLDDLSETDIEQLENLTNYKEMDTYEFLNKTNELKEIYNKMPKDIREKYNNLAKFEKEYLPQFINEQKTKFEKIKKYQEQQQQQNEKNQTNEELKKQIKELQEKINNNGDEKNV